MSTEIRLSNLINDFEDMDDLLSTCNEFVYKFLERSMIQTKQTRAVTSLRSRDNFTSLIFGDKSPLIKEEIMTEKFTS